MAVCEGCRQAQTITLSCGKEAPMMKYKKLELDWCTVHSYFASENNGSESKEIELSVPLEVMRTLVANHGLSPLGGAGAASYSAFQEWLGHHDDKKDMFYGSHGFDIASLVDIFDKDLQNTAKIELM